MSFRSYAEERENPTFAAEICDFAKFGNNEVLHKTFNWICQQNTFQPWDEAVMIKAEKDVGEMKELVRKFVGSSRGQFSPVCSIIGAWGAQEALKAVSGKFTPIKQFMYYDALELLK